MEIPSLLLVSSLVQWFLVIKCFMKFWVDNYMVYVTWNNSTHSEISLVFKELLTPTLLGKKIELVNNAPCTINYIWMSLVFGHLGVIINIFIWLMTTEEHPCIFGFCPNILPCGMALSEHTSSIFPLLLPDINHKINIIKISMSKDNNPCQYLLVTMHLRRRKSWQFINAYPQPLQIDNAKSKFIHHVFTIT